MSLTAEQANALLDSITTKEQLRDLINQLDIHSSGSITVLYSGYTANGLDNSQIIQGMLHNGDTIRVIDTTEAAKFLNISPDDPHKNNALLRSHYYVDVLLHGDDGDSTANRSVICLIKHHDRVFYQGCDTATPSQGRGACSKQCFIYSITSSIYFTP
ncbi:RTX toxin [Xylella fastidiosa]|uniref:RTX toxin n=1 Tax=Xylella fastidiosa TaxID=2371 RepID=UPI003DA5247A